MSSTPYFSSTPWRARSRRSSARSVRPSSAAARRAAPFDDPLDDLPGDRLDVGDIGRARVGHDGRRVGVDQDDR